jgi:hypothetical protein
MTFDKELDKWHDWMGRYADVFVGDPLVDSSEVHGDVSIKKHLISHGGCMKELFHRNGLSIVLFGFFILFEVGLSIVGQRQYNQEQFQHGQPPVGYLAYMTSASFIEATMENWESEFLQMFAFVVLTAFLYQQGSAESRKLDEPEAVGRDPRLADQKDEAPWPVRKGGLVLKLYENSLSLGLFLLFATSFALHILAGARKYSLQELAHGGHPVTAVQYVGTAQFWFESLQNWQSEFFSIGMMVVLSIVLRQRGSPESKPVDSPHRKTGHE